MTRLITKTLVKLGHIRRCHDIEGVCSVYTCYVNMVLPCSQLERLLGLAQRAHGELENRGTRAL